MLWSKKMIKAVAALFLLSFLHSLFFPTISHALTNGYHQPEYTSFESMDATDVVNLVTGDLSYSIPILQVPSPEGGFSVPLSYHGGIRLEQEASWVGLGWNLNVGAIARNINGYADDYNGSDSRVDVNDPGGYGYVKNFVVYKQYFDSEKGSGGVVGLSSSLSYGWGTQQGLSVAGITFSNEGVKADPVGIATSVVSGAIIALTAGGAAPAVGVTLSLASTMYSVTNAAVAFANTNTSVNINDWTLAQSNNFFRYDYHWYLQKTFYQKMYGSLYLGNMAMSNTLPSLNEHINNYWYNTSGSASHPVNFSEIYAGTVCSGCVMKGTSSDMIMNAPGDLTTVVNPTHVAYDNYNVMGYGVSGNIQPYRVEVGTLAYPFGNENASRMNLVDYYSYKLPFRYPADIANNYSHHIGQPFNSSSPSSMFTISQMGIDQTLTTSGNGKDLNLILTDLNITGNRFENNREGFRGTSSSSYKLAGSKYISWFTNDEIEAGTSITSGEFIDCKPSTDRASFRSQLPGDGIGGFSITRQDGLTYHYALPVYNHKFFVYNWAPASCDPVCASSQLENNISYASTWLLTAITGPDFVDRGGTNGAANGIPDENDWGYWVKFDYGKFSNNYMWRFPYYFEAPFTLVSGVFVPNVTASGNITEGERENYYLDKISTRTHTALFIKSGRVDGKSSFLGDAYVGSNSASSSLKLDEIIILANKDYDYLTNTLGLSPGKGGDTFSNNTDNNANVFDATDFNTTAIVNYIKQNRIRKIRFNYAAPGSADELAKETLNSFSSVSGNAQTFSQTYSGKSGRLTLKSVSFYGKNDDSNKIMPDYEFMYYDKDAVYRSSYSDGWGMNQSSSGSSHGREWSLKKIITPLGGEMEVEYERDTYSSVSGIANDKISGRFQREPQDKFTFNARPIATDLSSLFFAGNTVEVTVKLPEDNGGLFDFFDTKEYTVNAQVVSYNSITGIVTFQYINDLPYIPDQFSSQSFEAWITVPDGYSIYGGDLRVSQISVKDEFGNKYKTKYLYTVDGLEAGLSSGVCSKEEGAGTGRTYDFYSYYDYPSTPVMYGKVTVLQGVVSTLADFNNKSEYVFKTPHHSMLQRSYMQKFDGKLDGFMTGDNNYLKMYNFNFIVNTSQIGRIEKIKNFDKRGNQYSEMVFGYVDNGNNQPYGNIGVRTEGSILFERRYNESAEKNFFKLLRTTSQYNPNILSSVTITEQGITKYVKNTVYESLTGNVLETEYENSWGEKYITEIVPAYMNLAYAQMGSKVENVNNKNMLSQVMLNTLYVVKDGEDHIVKADAQTWNKNWTYRELQSDNYTDLAPTADNEKVWRKHSFYVWKSISAADGTVSPSDFVAFNAGSPHANWQKVNEITGYNHFSLPIEAVDINSNYASSKIGYNDKYSIVEVANAKYKEYVYSGAEDMVNTNFFGGEVKIGTSASQYLTSSYAHTGKAALKVNGGGEGFIINPSIEASGFQNNKTYRASVWLHNSNNSNGQLFYKLYDSGNNEIESGTSDVSQASTVKAGNWYLLFLDIPPNSSAQSLKIGVKNTSTNTSTVVYFDDFRVLPKDASMSSYVYDETTGQVLATLDNENFATRYTYDIAGRITKVEREIADRSGVTGGLVKVREDAYNFAK